MVNLGVPLEIGFEKERCDMKKLQLNNQGFPQLLGVPGNVKTRAENN